MSLSIGIFYGSTTCYTEMAAEKIQEKLQEQFGSTIEIFDIKDTSIAKSQLFDFIIFGISTWDFGELQEDWESTWDHFGIILGSFLYLASFGDHLGGRFGIIFGSFWHLASFLDHLGITLGSF